MTESPDAQAQDRTDAEQLSIDTLKQGLALAQALKTSGLASAGSLASLLFAELKLSKSALMLFMWFSMLLCFLFVVTVTLLVVLGIVLMVEAGLTLVTSMLIATAIMILLTMTCLLTMLFFHKNIGISQTRAIIGALVANL